MKGLLFTYLLTVGGAVTSLFQPFSGLLVYICFAIIRPEYMWHWAVPPGNYSRIVALALLAGWAMQGFGNWRFGSARGIVAALVAFLLWAVLGAVQAAQPSVAWGFVENMAKVVLPFLVGISTIDSADKLKKLAWVIVLSHGYVAYEMNMHYLHGYNMVHFEGFGGMDNNCVAIAMVTCIGPAMFLGLSASAWWQKGAAFAACLLIAHTVLLTFSRGGMLAMLVVGAVTFLVIPPRHPRFLVLVLALLIAWQATGTEVIARFRTSFGAADGRDVSAQSRLDLWRGCWDSMTRSPVFGVGPDHWPLVVERYGYPRGKEAHSLWLQLGAELGFPGLIAVVLFYTLCIIQLWPIARRRDVGSDDWLPDAARMVVAALPGFAVAAQFVSLEGLETPYYVALIGAGALKLHSDARRHMHCTPAPAPAWSPLGTPCPAQ